ncbi:hypothetical protein GCM10027273_29100 [Nocardioides pakistanensis]
MLDDENTTETAAPSTSEGAAAQDPESGVGSAAEATEGGAVPAKKTAAKRTPAKKTAAKKAATAKKAPAKRTTKKAAAEPPQPETGPEPAAAAETTPEVDATAAPAESAAAEGAPAAKRAAKKTTKKTAAKRTTKKAAKAAEAPSAEGTEAGEGPVAETAPTLPAAGETPATAQAPTGDEEASAAAPPSATTPLFQPPDVTKAVVTTRRRRTTKVAAAPAEQAETGTPAEAPAVEAEEAPEGAEAPARKTAKKAAAKRTTKKAAAAEPEAEPAAEPEAAEEGEEEQGGERRRRRRGGRRRRRSGGGEDGESAEPTEGGAAPEGKEPKEPKESKGPEGAKEEAEEAGTGTRRRRRRRRSGEGEGEEEAPTARARKPRNAEDEITALSGSTRLEAKKQRRREGREAGRRRAPIVSEAEFLARRESVDRVMVIRQREDLTQIAVLEDKVLVEHYVARESQTSLIGNVYLGRVQNVLPSMEAAFIDIGKGRNAVLYAGEVNWDALGAKNGAPRKIESVLKSGQSILVQVTKDPIGHKGARLTSQISLPGRFLVYVPDGTTSGISRKLPDTERNRLKSLLKEIVPDSAGVIVRTAAEGASEEELTRDVERLTARWADIESKVKGGNAPQLLYGEPDLTLKVVRDLFTEDFNKLVIAGDEAWDLVEGYVSHVAPDLADRLERYDGDRDVFAEYRIDEQIEKALDRKVWLPSGGSLVIDRTEAMTVVDVNTGKFTGSGGNLEETVTKNNLEAAEEIVRQLRLRDIGGIIVVDFIDMVLESNRDLVLRRMVECLGRDRTRHQVAEVTSLGLVQMTRKRIGTGLLEAFSETCEHCQGRGLVLHHEPVEPKKKSDDESRGRGRRSGRGRGRDEGAGDSGAIPSPKDIAAMAKHEEKSEAAPGETPEQPSGKAQELPAAAGEAPAPAEAGPESPTAEAEAAEETKPTRSRGGRGRGGRGRAAKAAAVETEPTAEQAEEARPEAVVAAEETSGVAEVTAGAAVATGAEPTTAGPAELERKGDGEASSEAPAAEGEPAAPVAPKIVTSTRRRGARRAAGPPPAATVATLTVEPPTASPTGAADGQVVEEAELDVDEPADSEPIAALVDDAELADEETAAGAAAEDASAEAPETPHVPVKKRGSRRR